MGIRFESSDESHAWSTFFAAQFPRQVSATAKGFVNEAAVAAECADAMLAAWRMRAYDDEVRDEDLADGAPIPADAKDATPTE